MDEKRVAEILASAVAAVDAAGVPDDLREPGYTAAIWLLAGRERVGGAGVAGASVESSDVPAGVSPAAGTGLLDRVATGMGIDPGAIRNLFEEVDGKPVLIVKSSKLPGTKASGAYDLALLIMAARQLGGVDDYTEASVLRDTAKRYGKFDSGNFGKHMAALDNFILTSGTRSTAKRKLTQPGIEAAADLAKKYLAPDGG